MSLRLKVAGLFIRGRIMTKWLELIHSTVCDRLIQLVDDERTSAVTGMAMPLSPAEFRKAMAEKHARLVDMLIERKGMEIALREGRQAMYADGVRLGERLRSDLRLSDDIDDLVGAARLLYRILGIEFEIEPNGKGARMLVRRCSLSERYSPITCEVISAMDEGVVEGLNPRVRMTFTKRDSDGPHRCVAELTWEEKR